MSTILKRGTAMLAAIATSLVFATTALAQMPTSPWKKGAPFPEPDEELYISRLSDQAIFPPPMTEVFELFRFFFLLYQILSLHIHGVVDFGFHTFNVFDAFC